MMPHLANPQFREMMQNPEFLRQISSPEVLQVIAESVADMPLLI